MHVVFLPPKFEGWKRLLIISGRGVKEALQLRSPSPLTLIAAVGHGRAGLYNPGGPCKKVIFLVTPPPGCCPKATLMARRGHLQIKNLKEGIDGFLLVKFEPLHPSAKRGKGTVSEHRQFFSFFFL